MNAFLEQWSDSFQALINGISEWVGPLTLDAAEMTQTKFTPRWKLPFDYVSSCKTTVLISRNLVDILVSSKIPWRGWVWTRLV